MTRRLVVALRADESSILCAPVDVATFQLAGTATAASAHAGIEGASSLVKRTLWDVRRGNPTVEGVALAVPGGHAWRDWDTVLAARFHLPSTRLWIAQAALRGELLQNAAFGQSALLFDTDGLRTGLLLDGRPHDGAAGAAGDVAHLGIDRTGQTRCICGRFGCLTALVQAGPDAPMPPISPGSRPMPSRRHGWLAVATIALLNIINPKILILEGSAVAEEGEFEWLAESARLGCLAPTRAGLADIARARMNSVLLGAAAFAVARHGRPSL